MLNDPWADPLWQHIGGQAIETKELVHKYISSLFAELLEKHFDGEDGNKEFQSSLSKLKLRTVKLFALLNWAKLCKSDLRNLARIVQVLNRDAMTFLTPVSALKAFTQDPPNQRENNEKIWDLVTASRSIDKAGGHSIENGPAADSVSVLIDALSEIDKNEISQKFRLLSIESGKLELRIEGFDSFAVTTNAAMNCILIDFFLKLKPGPRSEELRIDSERKAALISNINANNAELSRKDQILHIASMLKRFYGRLALSQLKSSLIDYSKTRDFDMKWSCSVNSFLQIKVWANLFVFVGEWCETDARHEKNVVINGFVAEKSILIETAAKMNETKKISFFPFFESPFALFKKCLPETFAKKSLFFAVDQILDLALVFYNNIQISAVFLNLLKSSLFLAKTRQNFVSSVKMVEFLAPTFNLSAGLRIDLHESKDVDFESKLKTPMELLKIGFLGIKIGFRDESLRLLLHSDPKTGSIVIYELETPETPGSEKLCPNPPAYFTFEPKKPDFVAFVSTLFSKITTMFVKKCGDYFVSQNFETFSERLFVSECRCIGCRHEFGDKTAKECEPAETETRLTIRLKKMRFLFFVLHFLNDSIVKIDFVLAKNVSNWSSADNFFLSENFYENRVPIELRNLSVRNPIPTHPFDATILAIETLFIAQKIEIFKSTTDPKNSVSFETKRPDPNSLSQNWPVSTTITKKRFRCEIAMLFGKKYSLRFMRLLARESDNNQFSPFLLSKNGDNAIALSFVGTFYLGLFDDAQRIINCVDRFNNVSESLSVSVGKVSGFEAETVEIEIRRCEIQKMGVLARFSLKSAFLAEQTFGFALRFSGEDLAKKCRVELSLSNENGVVLENKLHLESYLRQRRDLSGFGDVVKKSIYIFSFLTPFLKNISKLDSENHQTGRTLHCVCTKTDRITLSFRNSEKLNLVISFPENENDKNPGFTLKSFNSDVKVPFFAKNSLFPRYLNEWFNDSGFSYLKAVFRALSPRFPPTNFVSLVKTPALFHLAVTPAARSHLSQNHLKSLSEYLSQKALAPPFSCSKLTLFLTAISSPFECLICLIPVFEAELRNDSVYGILCPDEEELRLNIIGGVIYFIVWFEAKPVSQSGKSRFFFVPTSFDTVKGSIGFWGFDRKGKRVGIGISKAAFVKRIAEAVKQTPYEMRLRAALDFIGRESAEKLAYLQKAGCLE